MCLHRLTALLIAAVVLAFGAVAPGVAQSPMTLDIDIAPKMINMESQGWTFTVHGEILLSKVDRTSIEMNGLYPTEVFADDCGELVAKFDLDAVKRIVYPPETTLTFTGVTVDGVPFVGTAIVRVRQ